ncbi:oxidoreductase [Flavobacterium noncentrifugens]|uniref:Uncharacterized oxidoreductase n=1 Tax=Flavobacterium noncentrifugens TaxID=1128970 RepID=A0A1G8TAC5_9FLAO|nr:SDR family NAD(P)-dependent oxidoreductase [Flavobacterium noncentrifugens]GEP50149.1 oxidoreductase [Flavobacterium noncentrifugens]SDJ38526.1 uncharacterized oxidoreductase [Flavobacterium noncentrifugens]
MKTSQNTILITGGGSGIGFEIAKLFSNDNQIIITGRNSEKLQKAAAQLKNTTAIAADITNENDVKTLVETLKKDFPNLNILINNAGSASVFDLATPEINAFQKASDEINTNYLSIIRLTENLLPVLTTKESAIVNVSSIVALVPGKSLPTYSASKAALHSYTKTLRLSLANTSVKVFELMPPLVNTDFSKEIGGENGVSPELLATDLFKAFENDQYEIHTGQTADMFNLYHSNPAAALAVMNANGE